MRKMRWLLGVTALLVGGLPARPGGSPAVAAEPPTVIREIYVPFGELHVLLENQPQRVVLGREEYEELVRRARRTVAGEAPVGAALLSAEYTATVEEERAVWSGVLDIEVLHAGLQAVPLDISQVGLRRAVLDGKPASLGWGPDGRLLLFVQGQGLHRLELEMVSPVTTTAAQRVLNFRLPQAPAGRLRLVVPGDVEIRAGASVASRQVDSAAGMTRIELLPKAGDMSLVISANSRLGQQDRVVVARSVLVDEITRSSEWLHATVSLAVLHRPVDQFRFALPQGFEVTQVASPQLLRWSVAGPADRRVLEVRLREEIDKTVVLQLTALRTGPLPGQWSFPRLEPLDVASHTAVLGLLVEDRLEAAGLEARRLIPIDTAVLARAFPASAAQPAPGAPPLRLLAGYYAPQSAFELAGRFAVPPADWSVQTNLLLAIEERELRVQGGFLLVPRGEKLMGFDFSVPAEWEVTAVTDGDGKPLEYDRSGPAQGPGRVHVRLPQGVPPGQQARVLFRARSVPKGWLDAWDSREIVFPKFAVLGAAEDMGAVAVAAGQDLAVRPASLDRLTPLSESEKDRYGLAGVAANLVYRYEAPEYSARLAAERVPPRVSARTFAFARIEPDGLHVLGEILYTVEEARARQLAFSLPDSTPVAITIQALDDTRLKQWQSRTADGRRRWVVLLEEPRLGAVRLGIDFRQASAAGRTSDAPARFDLPLLQAEDVVYQSGLVAVEGNPEVEVRVETAARPVDVGELVDALYQPGRRLLGVFGFAGLPVPVTVEATPRVGLGLYAAIVQKAELTTHLSAEGVAQTQALFHLRTKATSLEVRLPEGSELWSALVDDTPVKPQSQQGRLLVGLPAAPADRLRKLQLVYHTPVSAVGWTGTLDLPAPALALGADAAGPGTEIPLADVQWTLHLPSGYQVVRNLGTVTSDRDAEPPPLAAIEVLKGVAAVPAAPFLLFGGQARESARRSALGPLTAKSAARDAFEEPKAAVEGREIVKSHVPMGHALRDAQPAPGREEVFYDEQAPQPPPKFRPPKGARRGMGGRPGAFALEGSPKQPPPAGYVAKREAPSAEPPKSEALPRKDVPSERGQALNQPGLKPPSPVTVPKERKEAAPPTAAEPSPQGAQQAAQPRPARRVRARPEGLSSLRISLAPPAGESPRVIFHSLGAEPHLVVRLADQRRFLMIGWLAVAVVLSVGVGLTGRSAWPKTRWILVVAAAGTVLAILPGIEWLTQPANMAVYAAAALVPYYLAVALVRWTARLARRMRAWLCRKRPAEAAAAAAALLLGNVLAGTAMGQNTEPPPEPVKVPEDALILPYDPSLPPGHFRATQVLVPYAKYQELQSLAFPGTKPEPKAPAAFGLAGASYAATLANGEFLEIAGRLEIDVFVDEPVQVPLGLSRAVLTRAELDGKPAHLEVAQPGAVPAGAVPLAAAVPAGSAKPPASILLARVSGKGRHTLDVALRLNVERRGGWRAAEAVLPAAAAAALNLSVPQAPSEVRLAGLPDRSHYEILHAGQQIQTALGPQGTVGIQWRPKVAEAQVDRTLTARSTAVLDVEDDGLRVFWQVELEFPRSQRDGCRLRIPAGYLIEGIQGSNVRTWQARQAPKVGDASQATAQGVEVVWIKPARDREQFLVRLSRPGAWDQAEPATFDAPALEVVEAALNPGTLFVRRSPRLAIRTVQEQGVSQTDWAPLPQGAEAAESPLGLRPLGAWQFSTTPYTLRFAVAPRVPSVTAEVQSLVKIAEHDRILESRITLDIREAPLYRVEVLLPEGFQLAPDGVMITGAASWAVVPSGPRGLLVVYLAEGRSGRLPLVIRGRLASPAQPGRIPLPVLEVRGVSRQEGELAVQADPDYDVVATELTNCQSVLPDRLRRWLKPAQFAAVQPWAIQYRRPDYGGWLVLRLRQPAVAALTITNVRFTPSTIEETLLLNFSIEGAGLREVRFVLPAAMRDGRIHAPMLRQKTIEPLPSAPDKEIRVRLEFQGEQRGDLRVLVENDRVLSGEPYRAPVPRLETPTTQLRQYVALQSAGRDEVVVQTASGVEPLGWEQREAEVLRQHLGRVTQAFAVRGETPLLELALRRRAAYAFAGARIGLGETLLILDAHGGYRAQQTYQVDNATEPFLEVELPEGARLWTAHVSGEPVKPAAPPAGGDRRARIPLIKTATGDRDYPVVLKYGGRLEPVGLLGRVEFPLIRAVNIRVEQSNVEIRLPESHRWLRFRGTLGPGVGHQQLEAERQTYLRKQQERLLEAARHGDEFAKVRALANLQASLSVTRDPELEKETLEELQRQEQALSAQGELDNRRRLGEAYARQKPVRSKNVVQDLGQNWDRPETVAPAPSDKDAIRFNAGWLASNALPGAAPAEAEADAARSDRKRLLPAETRGEALGRGGQAQPFRGPGVGQPPGGAGAEAAQKRESPPERTPALSQQGDVVLRYQQRLAEQAVQAPQTVEGQKAETAGTPVALAGQAAATAPAQRPSPAPTAAGQAPAGGLASIDVELAPRGQAVYFTTPGGELALSAWGVSNRLLVDLSRLVLVAAVTGIAAGTGKALVRRRRRNASAQQVE